MEKTNTAKDIQNRIKHILYILSGIISLWFFFMAVKCNIFGGSLWDRLMYFLGILSLEAGACLLIYKASFALPGEVKDLSISPEFLRSLGFSIICLMTLYYYNSSSDYGHKVGLRIIVLCWFMIINSYNRETGDGERNLKLYSPMYLFALGWMIFGFIAPAVLARAGALNFDAISFLAGEGAPEEGPTAFWSLMFFLPAPIDGKSLVPYVLWGLMVIAGLEAVIYLLKGHLRENRKTASLFGLLVMAFFALSLMFSGGRIWIWAVVVPALCLFLCRVPRQELLKEFSRGVMLSFWIMALFAVLFRPYYSFEFIRYPGWFASVASASMYRMLVAVVSFACLIDQPGIKRSFFPLVTLGASVSLLIMGMARTSILGTGCVFVFVSLLSALVPAKEGNKVSLTEASLAREIPAKGFSALAKKVGVFILCIFIAFPGAYTALRCIPALVARPVWIAGPEWFSDRIMNGESTASTKYMNVPQLGESLLDKLLGIDINLSHMAGVQSGPGDGITYDENGEILSVDDNVVSVYEGEDGQIYTIKDYSFTNDADNAGANGRFEILDFYLKNLNITGHRSMIPDDLPEGTIIYHAHNTYIQVAHDHGILTGILFFLVCALGFFKSIRYYIKNRDAQSYSALPLSIIIAFGIAGLTEWVYHPSIPIGFAFIIALIPLMDKEQPGGYNRE